MNTNYVPREYLDYMRFAIGLGFIAAKEALEFQASLINTMQHVFVLHPPKKED
jgi:hypothetical protein